MIPAFLLRLPWKWIGGALVILSILITTYIAGKRSRNDEVAHLTSRAVEAEASVKRLRADIATQNAAVGAMKAEADDRTRAGLKALAEAQAVNRRQSATVDALRGSSVNVYPEKAPCVVSEALWSAEGL